MKMKGIFTFLLMMALSGWGLAQEIRPVPVSPGSERGVARVSERCPTFSWSAIVWAAGYRVAVFEAKTAELTSYERMALAAAPVLRQDIPGKALSWTPSEGEGLKDGGSYIWYVQARDASGNGLWSAGKAFLVELEKTPIAGVEERVTRKLRERGVAADVISDVAKEIRPGAKAGMITREFTLKGTGTAAAKIQAEGGGLGAFRTLGNEGDAQGNTYYGTDTGMSLDGTGGGNSFFGYLAGRYTTGGNYNTFMGFNAGYSNTRGNYNTFIGQSGGCSNTTGSNNTFLGSGAGEYNETGNMNTFIGSQAGNKNTTGYQNAFLGRACGHDNTTGRENTSVGTSAGEKNQTGIQNTSVGHTAGFSNAASFGTFVGYQAGFNNTSGANNTFLGWSAGRANTTGGYNTFLGRSAGYKNVTGTKNVFLGYAAGYYETGSSKLYISSSTATFPLIYGDFSAALVAINGKLGVGVKAPAYPLHMASGARCTTGGVWTNASSRSLKENIRALAAEDAQEALAQLAPVRFNYKADTSEECLGFIAEDVPELVAAGDRKGLSSMDIVAVLTKVLQEQQKTNEELKKTNDELKKTIGELRAEFEKLKRRTE